MSTVQVKKFMMFTKLIEYQQHNDAQLIFLSLLGASWIRYIYISNIDGAFLLLRVLICQKEGRHVVAVNEGKILKNKDGMGGILAKHFMW